MSQSYLPWEQNKHNKLLLKSEVGRGKQSTYNLPPITHTYGKPPRKDSENAKEVTMSWQYHQQTKDQEPPRDFIRLNKNCVKENVINPREIQQYRQQHLEIKKLIHKGRKGIELSLPSDEFRYGVKNKPSTPMNQVMELHFARQKEQMLHDFYRQQYEEKVQKKHNRHYNSSQIRSQKEEKFNKNEVHSSVDDFKLERFKNVKAKINTRSETQSHQQHNQKNKKPVVVFILGGPGCGKGTQCERIVKNYNFVHLSAGDLLREEMETGSKNAKLIDSYIKEGKIVPKEIIVNLIKQAMERHGWEKNKYLIDGYPRSQDNVDGWNAIMGDIVDFKFILFFDCSEETMTKRVMKRAQGSGRSDDNIESLKKRFRTYQEQTKPIVDLYMKQNKVLRVDAEGHPDDIFESIRPAFEGDYNIEKLIKKPEVVFILGGPGCGKGTQCERIVRDYNFVHLSAGDLLREEMESGSKNAKLIDSYIKEGKIVPKEIIVNLIKQAMERHGWEKNKYLIDGYPRSQDNVDGWNAIMGDIVDFKFILFFDCSEDTMTKRVMKRAQGSGRSDDNIESLKKRFRTYQEQTKPIVQMYKKLNKIYIANAEGTPDQVYSEIKPILEKNFPRKKPQVVFILGGPGCGKGTQCERIVRDFGFVHLSAGDLLREEMESGSKNAKLIDSYIKEGKIVPKEIIVNLIKQAMQRHGWEKNKYLIDGYPRSQDNVDGWNAIMGDIVDFKFILFFDCSEETMTKRVMKRAQGSGRSDDNIESLKKRFRTYQEQTKPIVDLYSKQNKVVKVSAEASPDQVYASIKPVLEKQFGLKKKPQVVFILGGPGCGKGTQCERLVKNYNFVHLSAGDLLREEMESGSKNAKLIDSYIKEGKIVPKEIIVNLIKQAMERHGWEKNKYLIDGYPRSQDNVDGWNAIMGDIVDFKFIVFFDCSEETMTKRVMKRAQGSGRSDDNIESLKKRFRTYQESTKPIVEFYKKQNKVIWVNAEGTADQVFSEIKPIFDKF